MKSPELLWYLNYDFWIGVVSILATIILGILVWYSTKRYNSTQINLANDRLQKELFTEFNARYDKLNDWLERIVQFETLSELEQNKNCRKLRYKLNDYFNLCAEEYYWYSKGRIDELIWGSWKKGMSSWYENHPIIREAWEYELNTFGRTAFYMKDTDRLFK